jgi:hypothetical protein
VLEGGVNQWGGANDRRDRRATSPRSAVDAVAGSCHASWDELHDRYRALLKLVDNVLGVVPNCDRYLEIWPPAFRT